MRSTTRTALLRRLAVAAVAPVLAAGLAACGDSGSADTGTADSPASGDTSTDPGGDSGTADNADYKAGQDVDPGEFFTKFTQAMTAGKSAKIAMKMPSMNATGSVAYGNASGEDIKMDLTMDAAGQTGMRMIIVDGKFYMSMPGLVPDGKFMSLDPAAMGMGDLTEELKSNSPADLAKSMKDAVTKLTVVGDEKVNGEDTTHFTMSVDPAKAADIVGTELPAGADTSTASYDLWVGKDNLMRKVVVVVGGQQIEMTYSDWGKPVDIKAPAADDVIDASSMPGIGAASS